MNFNFSYLLFKNINGLNGYRKIKIIHKSNCYTISWRIVRKKVIKFNHKIYKD